VVCDFACDPGFVLPNCVTPFEALVASFGGTLIFSLVMVGAVIILALPFLILLVKRQRQKRQKVLDDLRATGVCTCRVFN
jgi:hypothetical protein